MIHDIIYEQNYLKRVHTTLQETAKQNFMVGRQQGWTDAVDVIDTMLNMGLDLTVENFVGTLQQKVLLRNFDSVNNPDNVVNL